MTEKLPHENEDSGRRNQLAHTSIDSSTDVSLQRILAKYELIYSIVGLLLGLARGWM